MANSNNGIEFISLGRVSRKGSNGIYSFYHDYPPNAINYYRLKIVDKDGKYEYSQVRILDNTRSFELRLSPNPANDKLFLSFEVEKKLEVIISITDISGRQLLSRLMYIEQGAGPVPIDISSLIKGGYFLEIRTSNRQPKIFKFQKL